MPVQDTQPQVNKIKAINPSLDGNAITYLNEDTVAGATVSLSILDKSGFLKAEHNADTYFDVLIGNYGQEKSELVKITADDTVNQTLTATTAPVYSHSASDPVTFIPYDKVRLYGSATSGTITITDTPLLTIGIDASKQYTDLYYEGTTKTYFVIAYYNSATTELSPFSEEITSTSFTRNSAKRVIESGVIKALTKIDESENSELNWDKALTILQDGVDEIITRKRKWSFLHKIDTSISTVVNQSYIERPSDLLQLEFIVLNGIKLGFISRLKYNQYTKDGTVHTSGDPVYYTIKNNKVYLEPTPSKVSIVTYEYFSKITEITKLSTEINIAFVPMLIYYCAAQFAYIRGNDKRGDKMYTMYLKLLEQQVEEYSGPEQSGDAESVETTSHLNED